MIRLRTIRSRILALGTVLATIGVLVRHFIALPMMQDNLQELVAAQQLSIASYVARGVDYSISSRLNLIGQLAADFPPELVGKPEHLRAWLKERQRLNPLFNSGLMVIPPNGNGTLASYPVVEGRDKLDYSKSDWFLNAMRLDRPVMGVPFRGRASGEPIIMFSAPLRDGNGKLVAEIAGVSMLDAPGFLDALLDTRLGATGGFLLISPADKLFIASTDPGMVLTPTPPPGVNPLHDRAMAGFRGTGITVNAKGTEELSAIVTVPSTGWFVVARMPTAEAFRPLETMRRFSAGASLIIYVVVFCILFLSLTTILRPLMEAARAMRRMADGKSGLAPLPMVRDDEVGNLVTGFNYLVDKLRTEEAARRASEAQLEFLAHHDSLTGLYNRAMLEDHLQQALARGERSGQQVALLFCDLDGFKAINDEFGHETGDAVLRQVAQRLCIGRRRTDTVARLGGDEFIILLADLGDARVAAQSVAEQCLAAVAEPIEYDGRKLTIGISIGIAVHDGTAVAPSYLMSKADVAMYRAKRAGKGSYFFIDDDDGAGDSPARAAVVASELLQRSRRNDDA
jgi:diguanylate cyclase (GGDEF)-like protein